VHMQAMAAHTIAIKVSNFFDLSCWLSFNG
jgi:hypothetical protein